MKKFFLVISLCFSTLIFAENDVSFDIQQYTLDAYLNSKGVFEEMLEGHMQVPQKDQFIGKLNTYSEIKRVAEIGLNAGHSAEMFFQNCKDLEKFVSFDINSHHYTKFSVEYFSQKYKDRFVFVEGDSLVSVPEFAIKNPQEKFDLIYVDGNHFFKYCYNDIVNFKSLAHKNTILWIDDYDIPYVSRAVRKCIREGIIEVKSVYKLPYRGRKWIEARYILSK